VERANVSIKEAARCVAYRFAVLKREVCTSVEHRVYRARSIACRGYYRHQGSSGALERKPRAGLIECVTGGGRDLGVITQLIESMCG